MLCVSENGLNAGVTLNLRLRMEPLHSHSNTGIYTPSHDELLDLVDYLRSQSVKGLPPQISAILDNLEKSMFRTTSMTDDQQSSAYHTPLAVPQPEIPAKASSHIFRSLPDGNPDQTHRITDVSFFGCVLPWLD